MLVQSNKAAVVEPAVVGEEDWRAAVSLHLAGALLPISNMRNQIDLLAAVTVLGVLEQGKCALYNAR